MRLEISKEKKIAFKQRAHSLNPVVILGNKGLTPAVIAEIDHALKAHELIKIKLRGLEKEARLAAIETITEELTAAFIDMTGFVAILYRPRPPEE